MTTALLYVLAVPVIIAVCLWFANHDSSKGVVGGSGRVVGIVGRMGSGKSYFAVRMAYRRLMAGANVCTNFSMQFDQLCKVKGCEHDADCIAAQLASRWRRFTGWEQMIELEDCIVIVDECHLYAPSNKTLTFPDDARWKLSMARKYHLDLYWLTQHENRVNTVLKDLTNMMYVCSSWFSAAFFSAKGYEPEKMRKKGQHIDRKFYRFNLQVAQLYNTLEILEADGVHMGAGTRISELAQARNAKQAKDTAARKAAAPAKRAAKPAKPSLHKGARTRQAASRRKVELSAVEDSAKA